MDAENSGLTLSAAREGPPSASYRLGEGPGAFEGGVVGRRSSASQVLHVLSISVYLFKLRVPFLPITHAFEKDESEIAAR